MECTCCGNADTRFFLEDRREADIICLLCGVVVAGRGLVDHRADGRSGRVGLGDLPTDVPVDKGEAVSTPYNRVYHNSENLANYLAKDPRVPDSVVDEILAEVRRTATCGQAETREELRERIRSYQSKDIKRLCQSVSATREDPTERKRVKQYGERFVQIKLRLCELVGAQMAPSYWLPASVLLRVRGDFYRLSVAFDVTLYRPGRKRTRKDVDLSHVDVPQELSPLARHNMISYNFIQHELVYKNAPELYERAQLDFFFPRPRTPKVLDKLTAMYNEMARCVGFPESMLTGLEDKVSRSCDWSLERCTRNFPPVLREIEGRELTQEEWLDREFDAACEKALLAILASRQQAAVSDGVDWQRS
jgi:hypothetical protein